jgi:HTH-type transcriptional regulator, competence development regulator
MQFSREAPMAFGDRIRELRTQKKLTQRELATEVGRDFTYISKIENNKNEHTPSVETIIRLARALDADELELMELANKMPPALVEFASNKYALKFFRRASKTIKTPEEWQDLLNYLDSRKDNQN